LLAFGPSPTCFIRKEKIGRLLSECLDLDRQRRARLNSRWFAAYSAGSARGVATLAPRHKRQSRFVFAVAGDEHVAALGVALAFLRGATRGEIVVVQRQGDTKAAHDQCLMIDVPPGLSDHHAAIWLKTGLQRFIGLERPFCYLDSDVIALSPAIEQIFAEPRKGISFASDHATIDGFSRWAVRCSCSGPCGHLREALFCDFQAEITELDFLLWNGGVFVADSDAEPLLDLWHGMVSASFKLPYWRTRDQGLLAGAAFRCGLQHAPRLPATYNTIIDCYDGIPRALRSGTPAARLAIHQTHLPLPRAVAAHFINGGIGRTGWPHWDHLAGMLETAA